MRRLHSYLSWHPLLVGDCVLSEAERAAPWRTAVQSILCILLGTYILGYFIARMSYVVDHNTRATVHGHGVMGHLGCRVVRHLHARTAAWR